MTFANTKGGLTVNADAFAALGENDIVKILFAENPAVVIQTDASRKDSVESILNAANVKFAQIATVSADRTVTVNHGKETYSFDIDALRDVWFKPSFLLDSLQTEKSCAQARFDNYKKQAVKYTLPSGFKGSLASRGLTQDRTTKSGIRAAIIREKGVNGDREMAYSLYLAGFDVKDVHMTDLMSGAETLDDVNMIVFCGGFSNSDVLGSAKGWASGFRWNDNARKTLERFYSRPDTLSLGICNGCQLMIELGVLQAAGEPAIKMEHNRSGKFESQFLSVIIPKNDSVMFGSLSGVKTGIWVAHGEGRFNFPTAVSNYNVIAKYAYNAYPANPNGSPSAVAGIASKDGRHLAMMPHLERAIFPWQCGYYPRTHRNDDVTIWIDAFINARQWIEKTTGIKANLA
jgi:phosphoribosylformylglycinamidine synthase